MKFIVSVDRQEDGKWVADCPTVPGCRSTGATKNEAMENVEQRIHELVSERPGLEMPLHLEVVEKQEDDWLPPEND